jgi:hypothetical protein
MSRRYYAVDDGGPMTLVVLAGPTSKATARDAVALDGREDARVMDEDALDLVLAAGGYSLEDARGERA